MALDAIIENVTLRPRDIVNLVMLKTTMSEREKKTLHQFVSHHLSMEGVKSPQTLNGLVVPEELKYVIDKHMDIGDHEFLIFDSKTGDPSA